jgi:hypothetical protein
MSVEKSALGRATHSRRTAQAGVRDRAIKRRQVHGQTAVNRRRSFSTEKISSGKDWQDKSSIQNYRESSSRVHIDLGKLLLMF